MKKRKKSPAKKVLTAPHTELTLEICAQVRGWIRPYQRLTIRWATSRNTELVVSLAAQGYLSLSDRPGHPAESYIGLTPAFAEQEELLRCMAQALPDNSPLAPALSLDTNLPSSSLPSQLLK